MPAIPIPEAIERLTEAVGQMRPYELRGFYNEVFPETPRPQLRSEVEVTDDKETILNHFREGLAVDEVLDFWRVAFAGSRHVRFNEEDEMIHYKEPSEAFAEYE